MSSTRYRPSRTLTRRLCRLPGEERSAFKPKVRLLRQHFEQFNVDASELCQWMMGLRKRFGDAANPASFGTLGDFLLEPVLPGVEAEEGDADIWRLRVFDHVAGFRSIDDLSGHPIPAELLDAMTEAARSGHEPGNTTAARLFERLRGLQPAHRLVLLKSAAEWIVARYQRGVENWQRRHAEWEKEKHAWEQVHPELTPELRDRFTGVFKALKDPENADGPTGVRRRNPRICRYGRLKDNTDNCCYAGSKGHGPLCWKFAAFKQQIHSNRVKKECIKVFVALVAYCNKMGFKPSKVLKSPYIGDALFKDKPKTERNNLVDLLRSKWNVYLEAMGSDGQPLNQVTVMQNGCLPHCTTIGECFEKSKCLWNPHTELCGEYKRRLLDKFHDKPDLVRLEGLYRDWRALYLAGPRKPSFRYPSSRDLPMPKVFGKDFYKIDFERSILGLRLEGEAGWLKFGFMPWPRKYRPSRREVADLVSSIHVQFVGQRVRAGFHFETPHKPSRIGVSQDDLDELRSRVYPRQAQDKDFLKAAHERILQGPFAGAGSKDLRVLAVDMGMTGAQVAFFQGETFRQSRALPINKIEKLYDQFPEATQKDQPKGTQKDPQIDTNAPPDERGLRKEHVGRHLQAIAHGASALAEHRATADDDAAGVLLESDFRGLKRHIAWMARDWARLNARQIMNAAEEFGCDLIVFESLRGHRVPGFDKMGQDNERKKQEQLLYAFGRVRRKVTEKAVERGMRVVTVPYFKSSQVCARCGKVQENRGLWLKNKKKKRFKCEHEGCRHECNSDENAARVLGGVFWGRIVLPEA